MILSLMHASSGARQANRSLHLTAPPPAEDPVTPSLVGLMPLTPVEGLLPRHVAYLDRQRWTYTNMRDGFRPAGRFYRDDSSPH